MKIKDNRKPHFVSVDSGKDLTIVPLGRKATKQAILWREDYELPIELGVSPHWSTVRNGYVSAPCGKAPGNQLSIARVLMDAKEDENVRFLDADPLNLRRENLEIVEGWASHRDRDHLENKSGGTTWNIEQNPVV